MQLPNWSFCDFHNRIYARSCQLGQPRIHNCPYKSVPFSKFVPDNFVDYNAGTPPLFLRNVECRLSGTALTFLRKSISPMTFISRRLLISSFAVLPARINELLVLIGLYVSRIYPVWIKSHVYNAEVNRRVFVSTRVCFRLLVLRRRPRWLYHVL